MWNVDVKLMNANDEKTVSVQLPVNSVKRLTDSWKKEGWYCNCPHIKDTSMFLAFGNNLNLPELNRLLKCLVKNSKRLEMQPDQLMEQLNNRLPMIEENIGLYRVNVNKACHSMNSLQSVNGMLFVPAA